MHGLLSGLENGCFGYQVNRKSGGRLSGQQDIRIIAILDTGCSLVRSELKLTKVPVKGKVRLFKVVA